jgi:cyclophilin family peptidyl-prolyl cis-trans isomerase
MNLKAIGSIIVLIMFVFAALLIGKMTGNVTNSPTKVKLETNYGNIVVQLNPQKAPISVANFLKYVNDGFYDNTTFHRILANFMIQGGGFTTDGVQKQTYAPIKLESNNGLKNDRGTIAMARTPDPNSATSQFFINVVNNDFLNYKVRDEGYAVFGQVVNGMDVVDKIAAIPADSNGVPVKEVVIIKATVLK